MEEEQQKAFEELKRDHTNPIDHAYTEKKPLRSGGVFSDASDSQREQYIYEVRRMTNGGHVAFYSNSLNDVERDHYDVMTRR